MLYDPHDTIAAIASAPGGAARGIVRISGPRAAQAALRRFTPDDSEQQLDASAAAAHVRTGAMRLSTPGGQHTSQVSCQLYLWPTTRSYTRQPSVEIHTVGSPPLLELLVAGLGEEGVRPAQPGEFTLRAFLAGRIDLTQAEAVLGVIDAEDRAALDVALSQLAGGLARPMTAIRSELMSLLAELEAGLDFVEEDIEFVSRGQLQQGISAARAAVTGVRQQLGVRATVSGRRRVVLIGPANAGKSSLFNAMVRRYGGAAGAAEALVSPQAGTTRDYLEAPLDLGEARCLLVDTAGAATSARSNVQASRDVDEASRAAALQQQRQAALQVLCISCDDPDAATAASDELLCVFTKSDLSDGPLAGLACSTVTGEGLEELARRLAEKLADSAEYTNCASGLTPRCRQCLSDAASALERAESLVEAGEHDELIAAELRGALDRIGEMVGAVYTDDLLDQIFSQFCIGK